MCDNDDDIFSFKSLRRIGRSVFNDSVAESTESTKLDEETKSKTAKSKASRSVKQTQSKSVNSKSFINQKTENSFATKQKITKKKTELSKLQKCKSHDVKLKALTKDSVSIDKLKNRQSHQKIKNISGKLKERECLKLGDICSQSFPKDSKGTMGSTGPQRLRSQSVSPKKSEILPETLPECVSVSKINLAVQHECSIFSKVSDSSNKSPDCDGNNATDGRCPFCQMPFSILRLESPNSHTMQCMDIPLKTTEECSAGLYCDSTIPSHYRRFLHSNLAMQLAGLTQEHAGQDHTIECVSSFDKCSQNMTECQESRGTICSSTKRKLFTSCSKAKKVKVVTDTQASQGDGSPRSRSMLVYLSPTGKNGNSHSSSKDDLKTSVEKPTTHFPASESRTTGKVSFSTGNNYFIKERVMESEPDEANFKAKEVTGNDGGFFNEANNSELSENETLAIFSEDLQRYGRNTGDSLEKSLIPNSVSVEPSKSYSAPSSQESVVCSELPRTGLKRQMSLFSFFQPHCRTTKQSQHLLPEIIKKPLNSLSPKVEQNSDHETVSHMKFHISKNASELTLNVISPALSSHPAFLQKSSRSGIKRGNSDLTINRLPVPGRNSGKQCPFYKKIPGTKITVDAFSYGQIEGCEAYILTHFHSDHYNGLNKRFSHPIFCSPVTGNLVEKQLGVASCWINRLPLNKQCQVTDVWLTLMEANHCPGAVIILFELLNGKKILHTGDFRADTSMESYPALTNIRVDELYLDTTYCNTSYAFPPQSEVVQFAVTTALKAVQKEPKTLVVCGAYTIGKEKIFAAIAEALHSKVCVQATKKRILDCLEDPQLKKMVSVRWSDGCVHVLPMGQLNAKCLEAHLQQCPQFSSVLAFEPTGWTYKKNCLSLENIRPKYSQNGITVYGVPYSEHSSFLEMKRFVQFLQPKKIIPTVNNGSPGSRRKMEAIFKQWLSEQTAENTGAKFISRKSSQQSLGHWLGN